MKIFFSHSSNDKAIVREVRRHLPECVSTWVDEKDLPFGANISGSIQAAINSDVDLVVVFLSSNAMSSKWVRQELNWAIEREKRLNCIFVIPVVIGKNFEPSEIAHRLYIRCYDQTEAQVKLVSNQLYGEVVKLAFNTIDSVLSPQAPNGNVENLGRDLAVLCAIGNKKHAHFYNPTRVRIITLRVHG